MQEKDVTGIGKIVIVIKGNITKWRDENTPAMLRCSFLVHLPGVYSIFDPMIVTSLLSFLPKLPRSLHSDQFMR